MAIPCKDCLVKPVCKNKKYLKLFADCELIECYIPLCNHVGRRNDKRLSELEELLKPTRWKCTLNASSYIIIMYTKC